MLQLVMWIEGRLRSREIAAGFTKAEQRSISALDAGQPQSAKLCDCLEVP